MPHTTTWLLLSDCICVCVSACQTALTRRPLPTTTYIVRPSVRPCRRHGRKSLLCSSTTYVLLSLPAEKGFAYVVLVLSLLFVGGSANRTRRSWAKSGDDGALFSSSCSHARQQYVVHSSNEERAQFRIPAILLYV